MSRNFLFLIAFLVNNLLCAQETKNTEQFLLEIDQKIPQILKDFYIPGAAVAIIENGEVVMKNSYGFSDKKKGVKVSSSTGFNAGSISKVVTGWGVMKLVHDGKLDLDAPVEKYLTRWHLPDSEFDKNEITVRRLLSHTAGLSLPSVSRELSFDDLPSLEEWMNGNNDGLGPLEIIIEPGTKWEYSGGGYGLTQLIIEEVSGQKFEDFMQAEVLDPLGMTNSSFKISDKIKAASASPYDSFGERTEFGLYTVQSAAGFHTTLDDFIRFAIASLPNHKDQLKVNQVLPVETVKHMHEPAPNSTVWGWKYGLGYQSVHMDDSRVFIGHSGSNMGWEASFRIESETMNGFIVFTNGSAGGNLCNPMFCKLMNWTSPKSEEGDCWRKKSIGIKLNEVIQENGMHDLAKTYATLKKEQAEEYDFSESQLNELGYHYMAKKEYANAMAIFKLNTEIFPYASNTYDSYGEALLANGDRKEAVKNYRYSILLNPNNDIGIRVLKGLGEPVDDIELKVSEDHLNLLAGTYSSPDSDKKILYRVQDGNLVRAYEDKDATINLIPIGNDEFVYQDRNIHVKFDSGDPQNIILMVTGEGDFKKVN